MSDDYIRNCPHCKREHRITKHLINKIIRCPHCQKQFWVYEGSGTISLAPVKEEN